MCTRSLSIFSFLLVIFSCQSISESLDSRVTEIHSSFEELYEQGRFNGNVLIAEKGKIIYEKSFGYADFDKKTRLHTDNLFNIASVSKIMTAVSIMILEEQNRLSLDDTVQQYLPEFPYGHIRIEHLLTHTSGLPLIQRQPLKKELERKGFSNQQVLELIAKTKPELYFEPGTSVEYANTNFLILALLVEEVSGLGFNEFLVHHIFEKAEMQNSFLKKKRIPLSHKSQIVSYYRRPVWLSNDFQSVDTLAGNLADMATYGNNYGESAIYTTARDLLNFHVALQNGTLLTPQSLKKMYTPFTLIHGDEYALHASSNYPAEAGLGWKVAKDSTAGKVVFHAGGFRGGRSFFIRNTSKDQCVIVLTNNEETNFHTFTFPMRALNQRSYELDKRSLARMYATDLSLNGAESARKLFYAYQDSGAFTSLISWDFEEIGTELLEKGRIKDAIAHYTLYAEVFPDEYSWALLGDAYLLADETEKAKQSFKKSLSFNPDYPAAREALEKIGQDESKN